MIDLHTHTTYSDGTDTVKELFKKANNIGLEIISITNHDDVSAYKELENINIKHYYNGKIIAGCEFTTHFDNRLIEVLGYGFDYKKIDNYLNSYYTNEFNKKTKITLFNRLLNKINENNLIVFIIPNPCNDEDLKQGNIGDNILIANEVKNLLLDIT